jgi:DNA-binding transcriptional LysR family regulator
VQALVQDAEAVLKPAKLPELVLLKRTFTVRGSDGFAESFGPRLIERIRREAPGVTLRLIRKLDRDSKGLRDGSVDLETGVIGKSTSPELRALPLFRDHFVGVVRHGHALSKGDVTLSRYSEQMHVTVGGGGGPGHVDEALRGSGAVRQVTVEVDGYSAACALVRSSDLVATLPEEHTRGLRKGLTSFVLPFRPPAIMISLLWHPRLDADPAHAWLRKCVKELCSTAVSPV